MLEDGNAVDGNRAPGEATDSEPWSTVPVAGRSPEKGRARLLSIRDLDQRTRAAKHCAATRDAVLSDLGGADQLSTVQQATADHFAALDGVARELEIRWMAGERVDIGQLSSVLNTLNRLGAALGRKRRPKDVSNDLTKRLREIDGATNGD